MTPRRRYGKVTKRSKGQLYRKNAILGYPSLCSFVFYVFLEFFDAEYSSLYFVLLCFNLHFKVLLYYLILSSFYVRSVFTVFLIVKFVLLYV